LKEATGSAQEENQPGIPMDYSAYSSLLQECVKSKALAEGKLVHCIMIKTGFKPDVYLQAKLVIMYAKCETMIDACKVFDNMPEQNAVSWNAMITGYANKGRLEEARHFFDKMPQQNIVSWNAMITTYAQNGRFEEARKLFDEMPERDIISWNAMIAGYAQNEQAQEDMSRMGEWRMPVKSLMQCLSVMLSHGLR
jgi:pentatricopeptide repeat protein